ncbi:phosphatase PAP2 family protein [Ancylobacter sp. 6x-1]|uniref:Phosphatase PAP2 family protein n=1 Tax=Ancylobacter crimeensis TaxID=2579147 RepID=A0ABT0D9J0_9HYPH|nr:phosphatase PAP2 family protein [Ancylobacter crimeensis]MCK0196608.1 phosphatase PAP2 family protein [Ancylobacter crimeensis]
MTAGVQTEGGRAGSVSLVGRVRELCAAHPVACCFGATLAISVLFHLWPALDIAVSKLFYEQGRGFTAKHFHGLRKLRNFGAYLPVGFACICGLALLAKVLRPLSPSFWSPRFSLFVTTLYLAAPALLVNGVLKTAIGRPRPANIVEFGGSSSFVTAWAIGDEALRNRSFVSGEAALVACLLPIALMTPPRWRPLAVTGALAFLGAVSLNRIAFGGHFLSDVLIAIGLTLAIGLWLKGLFYDWTPPALTDAALETRLSRIGIDVHHHARAGVLALRAGFARLARRTAT